MRTLWFTAAIVGITAACALGMTTEGQAGQWKQDTAGYWWQNDDGSYPTSSWNWLDGNGDGISECYYFDGNGYMAANTTVDGYTVDGSGAWVVDGVVQTQGSQNSPSGQPDVDNDSFVVGDKIIRTAMNESDGSGYIVMQNLDGSGYRKLLDVFGTGVGQVAYGDSVYFNVTQKVGEDIHCVIYRVRVDGSIETVCDTLDFISEIKRIGNKLVIKKYAGDVNEESSYYYFTPEDYTLRPYEQEVQFGNVIENDGFGSLKDIGFYTEDNYRLRGNQLEIVNDQGSVVKSLTLSGTFGTVTPLWGNDQFVIVKIESPWSVLDEYFKIPCNGGSGVEVSNPGDKMYVYRGILYTINGKYLYRWDGQGNVTKLCESNYTLSSYSFLQGYFFYRSAYDIVSVKL